MGARKSRAEWVDIVAEFEASGDSVEAFCRRRRIVAGTLGWWRWQLRARSLAPAVASDVRLVAVDVLDTTAPPPPAPRAPVIELVVADVLVRVETGSDPVYVAALVAELRRGC